MYLLNKESVNNFIKCFLIVKGDYTSEVRFSSIKFKYPTRPDTTVLNDFNLEVMPGQTVALVGSSGCGKSTTVQLTERFYDPEDGVVVSLLYVCFII